MNALRQISCVLASNVAATLISAAATFLLPRTLGVADYGYLQLYFFYSTYVGVLHLGWADGLLLRSGGMLYEQLDRGIFSGQLRLYTLLQLILAPLAAFVALTFVHSPEKRFVFACLGAATVLANLRFFVQFILQATSRMREYAALTLLEKGAYFALMTALLLTGERRFQPFIFANMTGLALSVLYGLYCCRDIVLTRPSPLPPVLAEIRQNLSMGSRLLLANVASHLIIGIVRQCIEAKWSVEHFGRVSLSLSLSNMLVTLVNAVAIVLFPMLRRMKQEQLAPAYRTLRTALMLPLFCALLFYHPGRAILAAWLPQYADSLRYLILLLPVCIFECRMTLLIDTYLRALYMEKKLLVVNLATVLLSLTLSLTTVFAAGSMHLAVALIPLLLAFRCIFAEIILMRKLNVNASADIIAELALTAVFTASHLLLPGFSGTLPYAAALAVYLLWKRRDAAALLKFVKRRD